MPDNIIFAKAAYIVTIVAYGAYAISLVLRGRALARRRAAMEARGGAR